METNSTVRPLLYLDSRDLDSKVTAGDSADRTIRAIMKQLTPDQQQNFIYWLGEALKTAKQTADSEAIGKWRAGILAEAHKYSSGGGVIQPPKPKPEPKPAPSLLDLFKKAL